MFENYNAVALVLRKYRYAANLSAMKIIKTLKVGRGTLAKWETGELLPSKERLPGIAKAYGIKRTELTQAYELAKEARSEESRARKRALKAPDKRRSESQLFSGTSGRRQEVIRANHLTSRYGRS